jgi:hypothetical protein
MYLATISLIENILIVVFWHFFLKVFLIKNDQDLMMLGSGILKISKKKC